MNNYYRLHGNGAYEALTREEYNHFLNMQRRIFGGGYVLFLTIKGKAATVAVGTELVRELQRVSYEDLMRGKWPVWSTAPELSDPVLTVTETDGRIDVRATAEYTPPRLAKPLRVFKLGGVYEYYDNTGRGGYASYKRHGILRGAYNAAANAWTRDIYL